MGERKPATIQEINLRVDEDFLGDIKTHPKQVKQFYTNNFLQRGLNIIMGVTTNMKAKLVEVTNSGALKVASVGSGIEQVDAITGTATSTESAASSGAFVSNKVRLVSTDYDFYFRPSPDGIQYQDQIYVFANQPVELDLVVTSFKVQRADVNDATYRVELYK